MDVPVLSRGDELKVLDPVVLVVTIGVVYHHAFGDRPMTGFPDKSVFGDNPIANTTDPWTPAPYGPTIE